MAPPSLFGYFLGCCPAYGAGRSGDAAMRPATPPCAREEFGQTANTTARRLPAAILGAIARKGPPRLSARARAAGRGRGPKIGAPAGGRRDGRARAAGGRQRVMAGPDGVYLLVGAWLLVLLVVYVAYRLASWTGPGRGGGGGGRAWDWQTFEGREWRMERRRGNENGIF